jgi:hypothetical protein
MTHFFYVVGIWTYSLLRITSAYFYQVFGRPSDD